MTQYAVQLDPGEPSFIRDPYPVLAKLRATGPVLWHEPMGMWLATTHEAVSEVLRKRAFGRIWTDRQPAEELEPFNTLHRNQLMENEPPAHTRLRRLVAGAFGRGHVERMRPRIESLAAEMVEQLDDRFDVLADYAEPMPVYVIADLLGVPREDHQLLRAWSQAIVHMYEPRPSDEVTAAAVEASTAFADYVRDVVAERRKAVSSGRAGDDLISDLIEARERGAKLSDDELVASVVLLLNAGHEASVNAFGNGMYALLTHPDQLARITDKDVTVETAVEELLRFDAPLQLFERTATADIKLHGERIAAGQKIACLMGSANRDEATFENADALDVGRDPNPHVGFGMGVHFCLGAPLARLELQISMTHLLRRFPRLELVGESPRRPTWVLRGFESIQVERAARASPHSDFVATGLRPGALPRSARPMVESQETQPQDEETAND